MRHRTGAHRGRPSLLARLPLYALVLSLQLAFGAALMGGTGEAPQTPGPESASAPQLVSANDVEPIVVTPARLVAKTETFAPPAARPSMGARSTAAALVAATPAPVPIPSSAARGAAGAGSVSASRPAEPTAETTAAPATEASSYSSPASPTPPASTPASAAPVAKSRLATAARARAITAKPGVAAAPRVASKPAARAPAARTPAAGRPVARRPVAVKPGAVEPVASKPVTGPAARRPAARRPAAKRPAAKLAPKKPAPKPAAKRPAAKKPAIQSPKSAGKPQSRWLPSGTGVWTNNWTKTSGGNPYRVIDTAVRQNVTHIFVKTGTLRGGFDGAPVLARLLPATRGTNVKIIAWDFPMLRDPLADAARLAAAAHFSAGPGMPRVAAVAPDIETRAEGTRLTIGGVVVYYRELRRLLPPDVAILATVPWPSEKRVGRYPYRVTAQYADAFIPMAYWFNRSPVAVTQQSIRYLERFGRPVMPAGQAYDPALDAPGLGLKMPTATDLAAFASASRRAGAVAVSFWAWQTATPDHWRGIHAAALGFPKGGGGSREAPSGPPVGSPGEPEVAIPLSDERWGGPFDRPS